MEPTYFEDVELGDEDESPMGRTISEADVYTQAGLNGSYNPIHTDRERMQRSAYGGRIVQHQLLLSVMTGLGIRMKWNLATIAAYGRDAMRFTAPVFIGDTVRLKRTVVETRERDSESGIVTFEEELVNQEDDLVLTDEYLVLVERRPTDGDE